MDTPPLLFSLNDDVLEEILSYFYGVRACCKSPQILRRICEYMTPPHGPDSAIDRSQPARHLRHLAIPTRAFCLFGADYPRQLLGGDLERDYRGLNAYDTAPLLSEVLERAVRIRKLQLGPFDQFLTGRKDIRRALKGLHHLTHLHLEEVGNTTLALLQDFPKGLQSLTLNFVWSWRCLHNYVPLLSALARFDRLERLSLVRFQPSHPLDTACGPLRPAFRSVIDFQISDAPLSALEVLTLFPRLSTVDLSNPAYSTDWRTEVSRLPRWPALRCLRLWEQDEVEFVRDTAGSVHELCFSLAPHYPYRRYRTIIRLLVAFLRQTSPVALELPVPVHRAGKMWLWKSIAKVTLRLRILELRLDTSDLHHNAVPDSIHWFTLAGVAKALAPLPLVFLKISAAPPAIYRESQRAGGSRAFTARSGGTRCPRSSLSAFPPCDTS